MHQNTVIFNQFVMSLLGQPLDPNGAKTNEWLFLEVDPLNLALGDKILFGSVDQEGNYRTIVKEASFEETFEDRPELKERKEFWNELKVLFNDLEFSWELCQLSEKIPVFHARNIATKDCMKQLINSVENADPSSQLAKIDLTFAKLLRDTCAAVI
jgi:hypothetical protein